MTRNSDRDLDRDLDRAIHRALSEEEREFLERLDEPSLPDLVADTFRGRLRFFTVVSWLATLVFSVLMFYCAWRMLDAEGRSLVLWQTATVFFMLGTALTKLWVWMEIHRKSLLRELKRIELRLVELGADSGPGEGRGAAETPR